MHFSGVFFVFLINMILPAPRAMALLTTSTLPKGIYSPSFRYGQIGHVGERYTGDGRLMSLGDLKSVNLDMATVKRANPEVQKLIDALNSFGKSRLGDKFDFGVLRVYTEPRVKYFAPIFAGGVSDHWTLGFGVPIITYQNQISIRQEYSNIAYFRDQFGGLSAELDRALNMDLAKMTNDSLISRGYKPLANRDETFLGDLQIASVYKFFEDADMAIIDMTMVGLPTGPRYDVTDLAAMNIFGRMTVSNLIAVSQRFGTRWSLMPYISYLANVPDRVLVRVPENEQDTLPAERSQQSVSRSIGNTLLLGNNLFYEFGSSWMLGVAYEYSQKEADRYQGDEDSRYDLLARNTHTRAERAKLEVTYSSVKSYLSQTAKIPLMVAFEVSDVIAGVNVERQLVQEMNLTLFF